MWNRQLTSNNPGADSSERRYRWPLSLITIAYLIFCTAAFLVLFRYMLETRGLGDPNWVVMCTGKCLMFLHWPALALIGFTMPGLTFSPILPIILAILLNSVIIEIAIRTFHRCRRRKVI